MHEVEINIVNAKSCKRQLNSLINSRMPVVIQFRCDPYLVT